MVEGIICSSIDNIFVFGNVLHLVLTAIRVYIHSLFGMFLPLMYWDCQPHVENSLA